MYREEFKNCTCDTLYIGISHSDNIDSIDWQISPDLFPDYFNNNVDTIGISLWKGFESACYILPDSSCAINRYYLFFNGETDTCYFFLIKMSDAKKYSWDEIRANELFRKLVVVKGKDGKFDRNIKYSNIIGN